MTTTNLFEYLVERLNQLPAAARLLLVLDPEGKLDLMEKANEAHLPTSRHNWKILRYDGNDLAFRSQFDFTQQVLVWVTGSKLPAEPSQIDLTSLVDIVRRADEVVDASLLGVLSARNPNETWPSDPINEYADIIGLNLGYFFLAFSNLKPHLGRGTALGEHSIQALVLSCLQSDVQPNEFLFRVDSPVTLLKKYVELAWSLEWDEAGLQLLQKQAREASLLPLGGLADWFEVNLQGLAQLIYFYRALSLGRISNIINQIRGLGLLDFDPEPLEVGLGQVMDLWEKDLTWRNRLIQNAEADLELETIHRSTRLLSSDQTSLANNLVNAEAPALAYSLVNHLVNVYSNEEGFAEVVDIWKKNRPKVLDRLGDIKTTYSSAFQSLACVLDEAAFIQSRLSQENVELSSLENLIKWYVQGRYFDLEYAHVRALMASGQIKEENLRTRIQINLTKLRERLRNYLDQADHVLAKQIQQNWHTYSTSPDLSSNILRDYVERSRLVPTETACLWLIIFDGMRYDTWDAVVKPRLQQVFEIKKEKTYISPLPSWTSIARTSITAGRTPDMWKGYRDKFTYNQALLAAKFLRLPENQYAQKLRFFSGMESDRTHGQFDHTSRYPYNILVFNISDDDLHKQRDHIGALNENIKSATDRILNFLDGLIKKDDTVIVTSDHGFIELDPGYEIVVKDSNRWQRYIDGGEHPVRFRFIRSEDPPDNLPIKHVLAFNWKMPDGRFIVAVGRHWFQREGSKHAVRYDHGGLSFAEMVVPGVVMQPIRERRIDLKFEGLPGELRVDEGQPILIEVTVANRGNQQTEFGLTYSLDTDRASKTMKSEISPNGKFTIPISLTPMILADGRKSSKLTLLLTFLSVKGQKLTRRVDIPVAIVERKDVVQISLGGLDDLDL